jgi:rhodanese-related sulfurtransferase
MIIKTTTPQELYDRAMKGEPVDLIDVRTPAEVEDTCVKMARSVPLDTLDPNQVMARRSGTAAEPLYVICRSGERARKVCEKFIAAGFTNVVMVEGGTQAWVEAGLPVRRGKRTIPLDGQVRIAIGSIVLAGALLSLVHPYFLALVIFMGAGLVYSGVSGFCGLALLLAKAPWNRGGRPAACSVRADDPGMAA